MNSWRVVVGRRSVSAVPILRHVSVEALLLDGGLGLGRHGRARGRTRVRSRARSQEPLLRRGENTVAMVYRITVRLDFQTLGRRECRRGRERLQVGQRTKRAGTEGQPGVEELRLEMVQDVRRKAAVSLHVAQTETRGKRTMQLFRGLGHRELKHKKTSTLAKEADRPNLKSRTRRDQLTS